MPGITRIAVNGAAGRMGRQILTAVAERSDCALGGAIEHPDSVAVGKPASLLSAELESTVTVTSDAASMMADFDVVIDFTRPESTLALLPVLCRQRKALVVGTTGFTDAAKATLLNAATEIPIVWAPNFSAGVTLVLDLLRTAARALADDYDIEIIEAHHRNKVDAPSGTALRMGEAIAEVLGRDLASCAVYGREGVTGVRRRETIGFETIRGGDIIGEHTVLFAGAGERVEITHKATDRQVFARGAVRAARWLIDQPAGLYDMADVVGLSRSPSV